ncbi:MAG: site-specific integrase [Atlantibacter hermannii]|uniref:tyrosine-type recombinase/integrase n=1 Tax=Atlantibacter hermannii TaxID=565 RepID=UPI00290A934B|nr:site-specific integrase [Atlantibacter hermannii]MDU7812666.1 site-specific integrase [Atlantibacter hermannii]
MAYFTVEKRPRSDGTVRYRCVVGVKENGKYLHRESKTFSKQSLAKSWGAKRVVFLEEHGIPEATAAGLQKAPCTLKDLIERYLKHPDITMQVSKRETLTRLMKDDVSDIPIDEITSKHLIDYCQHRKHQGRAPKTISNEISFIATVMKAAKPIFGIEVNLTPLEEAKVWLKQFRIIGPSQRRSRRPTRKEFELILIGLKEKAKTAYSAAPFDDIFLLSVLTCARIGEICRIRWDDIDEQQKAVLVRDRKDPRKKIGNHMLIPLLGDAWDIVQRQPRKDERIFPYRARSITQTYRQVRDELGIEDLRYHDLKREGASRLFEAGFSIEEVAQVTGHRSLATLWQVYTELFPKTLHEKFKLLTNKSNHMSMEKDISGK